MGLFRKQPLLPDLIEIALKDAFLEVSLFADQEIDYFDSIAAIHSPTGNLGGYLSKGKYHASVTISYINSTLSLEVIYDPDNRKEQCNKIRKAVEPYVDRYDHVGVPNSPDAYTDPVFRLEKKVDSLEALPGEAIRMGGDAERIILTLGTI